MQYKTSLRNVFSRELTIFKTKKHFIYSFRDKPKDVRSYVFRLKLWLTFANKYVAN